MSKIWAIADLHLSLGVPEKTMAIFGPQWEGYMDKIAAHWKETISKDDLVLIAGDISWALRLHEVQPDLDWIHSLPGTKVMIRGNHDYWWASKSKLMQIMPPSIHIIQNSCFHWNDVTIGGSRLWDSDEYRFSEYVHFQENPKAAAALPKEENDDEKIFLRELERLKLSLNQLDPSRKTRIAMTHYPPLSADLKPSRASAILEEYKIDICVFGHLHNLKVGQPLFGTARGITYHLTACDYLDFIPLQIV